MAHPEELAFGIAPADVGRRRLIDVRRAPVFALADSLIAGARWHDPAAVETWAATLPPGEPVIVYCVHGHEVSQGAAARLRAAGLDARFLIGGIEAWKAEGRPLQARPAADGGTP